MQTNGCALSTEMFEMTNVFPIKVLFLLETSLTVLCLRKSADANRIMKENVPHPKPEQNLKKRKKP